MKTIEKYIRGPEEALRELAKGNIIRYSEDIWENIELRLHDGEFQYRDHPDHNWERSCRFFERLEEGSDWRVLEEVKEWYDNLEASGPVLCKVWDFEGEERYDLVTSYSAGTTYPFKVVSNMYRKAEPVTTDSNHLLENKQ